MDHAFEFIIKNGGIHTEEDYPYIATDGICDANKTNAKGIFSGSCGSDLDHAMLVIGYGTESGIPYWLVKNSWGRDWAMDGYVKIGRLDITTHTIEEVVKPEWGTVMDFVTVAISIVE
ncbi:putative actinidain [Helianthus anomalus]